MGDEVPLARQIAVRESGNVPLARQIAPGLEHFGAFERATVSATQRVGGESDECCSLARWIASEGMRTSLF